MSVWVIRVLFSSLSDLSFDRGYIGSYLEIFAKKQFGVNNVVCFCRQ